MDGVLVTNACELVAVSYCRGYVTNANSLKPWCFHRDLVQIWRNMAEGPAIIMERQKAKSQEPDEGEEAEEDEYDDPNDAPDQLIPRGFEFMEEEEDEW